MRALIYHIRRRQRPAGGNQFYRDRSVRPVETFCGDDPTIYDGDWRSKAPAWTRKDGMRFEPCAKCVAKRSEAGRLRKDNPKIQTTTNLRKVKT